MVPMMPRKPHRGTQIMIAPMGMATAVAISLKANFCMVRSMPYFTMKAKKPRVTT